MNRQAEKLESLQELLKDTNISYLKDLTAPEHPQVEYVASLVAVHGLRIPFNIPPWKDEHAFGVKTWVAGKPNKEVLWLKDLLPDRIENARVLLFGYNSNVGLDTSTAGVSGAAENLLAKLKNKRQEDPNRPIMFICHSLGGIVVKRAISKARSSLQYQELYKHVQAIAFFATPHRGGLAARPGQVIAGALRRLTGNLRNSILEALRDDSLISSDIHKDFLDSLSDAKIRTCSFYEARAMPGLNRLVVDQYSAILGLPFPQEATYQVPESDHSTICKFEAKTQNYNDVIEQISDLVDWTINSPVLSNKTNTVLRPPLLRSFSDTSSVTDSHIDATDSQTSISTLLSPFRIFSRAVSPKLRDGPFYLLPDTTSFKFTGREFIMTLIRENLSLSYNQQTRLALYGLGGVGKTQIALEVASWYRQEYPQRSIFWVRAGSTTLFMQSLKDIATICNLVRPGDAATNWLDEVQHFLLDEDNGKWLMIIDNADNADTFSNTTQSSRNTEHNSKGPRRVPLIAYIPRCANGQILFTTNSKAVAGQLTTQGQMIEVLPMDQHDSLNLLRRHLDETIYLSVNPPSYQKEVPEEQDLKKLCGHLGYLPLALAQAAVYIRQQSLTVNEYIKLLELNDSSLSDLLEYDSQASALDDHLSKAVANTWKVAFDQIDSRWPAATALLSLMAFLDSQSIPKFLLRKFEPDERQLTAIALGTLQGYSLVNVEPATETVNIHKLIQLAVRKRLSSDGSAAKWASKALKLLVETFPNGDWETDAALFPHALQVLTNDYSKSSNEDKIMIATLASRVSLYYFNQFNFTEAENLSQQSWEHIQLVSNPPEELILNIKAVWSLAFRGMDHLQKAEKLAKEVLSGRKKLLGKTHVDTLEICNILTRIHQDRGDFKLAAGIVSRTLKSLQSIESLDAKDIRIQNAKEQLGVLLRFLGDFNDSETLLREAFDGYTKALGSKNPRTLKANRNLAATLYCKAKYSESEKIARETWANQKQTIGENHPDCVITLLLIADNLQAQENVELALASKRKIYQKAIDKFGNRHRYSLLAAASLASCLVASYLAHNSKKSPILLHEAETLYRHVAEILTTRIRLNHPEALAAQTGIACVLAQSDRLQGAEKIQRKALQELESSLGKEHPLTLAAHENLVRILWAQAATKGKVKEARKRALKVLELREKKLGYAHIDTRKIAVLIIEMSPDERGTENLKKKIRENEYVDSGKERIGSEESGWVDKGEGLGEQVVESGKYKVDWK
ncbi:MAG: hypothetical protein M1824_003803 [Vezdaea acicularis]|nr:MAG: hypothetical protein M1824_003803 [Vezdaea acicularis]